MKNTETNESFNDNSKGSESTPTLWYRLLYVQVIIAIVLGVVVGHFWPSSASVLKGFGDGFIALVKMMIAPVIFITVTTAIAQMTNLRKMGRLTLKTFGYFLFFSSVALLLGMLVGNWIKPGEGLEITPTPTDLNQIKSYLEPGVGSDVTSFIMHIIPNTFLSSLTGSSLLQVLLVATLFGFALCFTRDKSMPVILFLESLSHPIFKLVEMLMKLAPIGAFGAMAFTVGKFGLVVLWNLIGLVLTFYLTSIAFIVLILGLVCWYNQLSIFKLIRYLKDELFLVLATSSSESALPTLMMKLERLGCSKPVVGLVIPTGYSFNLDGTNIYLTLATLFIAQACNFPLSLEQQGLIFFVAMLSSKGAAGVSGSGFITLAATLTIVPNFPIYGMALLLGIDKFMSECRAMTNFMGNAVATLVVSHWDDQLDREAYDRTINGSLER